MKINQVQIDINEENGIAAIQFLAKHGGGMDIKTEMAREAYNQMDDDMRRRIIGLYAVTKVMKEGMGDKPTEPGDETPIDHKAVQEFALTQGVPICPACANRDQKVLKTRTVFCRECGQQIHLKLQGVAT